MNTNLALIKNEEEPNKDNDDYMDNTPLVSFLYELMRDYVPAGEIERITVEAEKHAEVTYSNKHLAAYAKEIANRLQRKNVK